MSGDTFDRSAAERIIRRAIELDDAVAPAAPDRVSEAALREAAEELGIDIAAVRRAAAEEVLGLHAEPPSVRERLVGGSRILAVHPFDCPAAEALERVDTWMRRASGFRRISAKQSGAEYKRRTDPMAAVQRVSRSITGREHLASSIDRLQVLVEPLEDGTCLVGFTIDRVIGQTATLVSAGTLAGGGSVASLLLAGPITNEWTFLFGVPVAVAAGWGIGAARKLSLNETEVNLNGVVQAIASEPTLGEIAGSAAANAVKGFAGMVNRGVSARRGGPQYAPGAQTAPGAETAAGARPQSTPKSCPAPQSRPAPPSRPVPESRPGGG
ncbi:MAG: hypothetical protein GX868_02220 [Actinobacteria bacterium]|nr:hypothetical protein [Actinomycetota bacterium]